MADTASAADRQRCPICLSDEGLGLSEEGRATSYFCRSCRAPFHRACAARHALAAADAGRLPLQCPVPTCSRLWSRRLVAWALEPEELERFNTAVSAMDGFRAAASGGRGYSEALSPRSVESLRRLGVRPCPQCRALIQKQPEGLLTGCDKMTCRCGCMFCFKCGMVARAGGVARCRCVGMHHGFIPRSEVLSNYSGASLFAPDEDLLRRSRGPASKHTVARLRKEQKSITADPPPFIHVTCNESNILSWDFLIEGPPDTPYDGGWYWGQLEIPGEYPFLPPLIRLLTPNGRFEVETWLCRSVFDYHPDGWQPAWTLAGVLAALLALMCQDCFTAGAIHPLPPLMQRYHMARKSLDWNLGQPKFAKAFPNIKELFSLAAERRREQGFSVYDG